MSFRLQIACERAPMGVIQKKKTRTRKGTAMRIAFKVFLCGIALSLSAGSCAADGSPAILILDATAQMSAKLGQQRKIDAMKSAVSAAVNRMNPDAQLAVWAIGTNPAKKCEDRGELVRLQAAAQAAGA